jgi:hypothetical protein
MSLAMDWLNGTGGLVAWIAIVVIIVGTGLLMRHLALTPRAIELTQVVWIVGASVGLLVIAGVGGFVLMHTA